MNKKRARSAVVIYAIILIVGFLLINKWLGGDSNVATNYSYTEFSADLNAGNIAAGRYYTEYKCADSNRRCGVCFRKTAYILCRC